MSGVRYAVVQATLDLPDVERLRRAFRGIRGLTAADAQPLAADAYGVLVKNLPASEAERLQWALKTEGIETELVPQTELPGLPPTKHVRRLELGPEALALFDPLGRKFPLAWGHLLLIAAGTVESTEFDRRERARPEADAGWGERGLLVGGPGARPVAGREVYYRETRRGQRTLELVVGRAVARYSLAVEDSAPLVFAALGEGRTGESTQDLARLVRALGDAAPRALQNRGAFGLRQEPPVLRNYPSRNAFTEEMTWILWRAARSGFSTLGD